MSGDMKIEVVVIGVSDVDRSKEFYGRLGWRLDVTPPGVVQLTPHGSATSLQFGPALTAKGYIVVSDIEATRKELIEAGVEVGELFHSGPDGPESGPDPEHRSYRTRATLDDPDGNTWLLQEVTTRLPGRVDPGPTAYTSESDLAGAMRRAAAAHGEHEKRTGEEDANWPDWYAKYMVAEQTGSDLPE
jgi:catechol 2,3-dioxygenase-like lactoylglutathione lyase family enzyme